MSVHFPLMADLIGDLRNFSANPQQRYPWGIPSLDVITEGPAPGEVFTVMGRSFSGKSIVATNIMANNQDKGSIFFSLEMPARQAVQRLYATWAGVDHQAVQSQVRANSLPHVLDTMGEAMVKHVVIDRPAMTLGDMSVYLEAYDRMFEHRPEVVIIDYLELIGGGKSSGEGWQKTEAIAGALKDWAKSEEVPVFVLHQTNRNEKEWDPPTADSARGAGFTESDVMVGMWNPWRDPNMGQAERASIQGQVWMNVLKNRVTGRTTANPIRLNLREDLKLVDLSALDARQR